MEKKLTLYIEAPLIAGAWDPKSPRRYIGIKLKTTISACKHNNVTFFVIFETF